LAQFMNERLLMGAASSNGNGEDGRQAERAILAVCGRLSVGKWRFGLLPSAGWCGHVFGL
jgi:hypothetical protein